MIFLSPPPLYLVSYFDPNVIRMFQVGGTLDRWEYVVAGPPMQEISIAEPLASSGETVVSPTVVAALGGEVR